MREGPAEESANAAAKPEKPSPIPPYYDKVPTYRGLDVSSERYRQFVDTLLSSSALAIGRTSDTDASLEGSIADLGDRIGRIETSIASISGTAKTVTAELGTEVTKQIEDQITPIRTELESIRGEILPQLQQAHGTIKSVEAFLKDNASFLATAVEAQGLIRGLEGEVHSVMRRLDALESTVNKAWDRRLTILSLIIAVVSAAAAIFLAVTG